MPSNSHENMNFLDSLGWLAKRTIQVVQRDGFLAMCRHVKSWRLNQFHNIIVDTLILGQKAKSITKITQIDELRIASDNRAEAVE